jgi:hypothetical protein
MSLTPYVRLSDGAADGHGDGHRDGLGPQRFERAAQRFANGFEESVHGGGGRASESLSAPAARSIGEISTCAIASDDAERPRGILGSRL